MEEKDTRPFIVPPLSEGDYRKLHEIDCTQTAGDIAGVLHLSPGVEIRRRKKLRPKRFILPQYLEEISQQKELAYRGGNVSLLADKINELHDFHQGVELKQEVLKQIQAFYKELGFSFSVEQLGKIYATKEGGDSGNYNTANLSEFIDWAFAFTFSDRSYPEMHYLVDPPAIQQALGR